MTVKKNQKSQVLPLDYPINPATTSGVDLADILNRTFNTMMSNNAGLDRPLNIERGGLWSQLDVAGDVILYMFDGVNDVEIGNLSGGTFTPPNNITSTFVQKAGDTMAGYLTANADPVDPLHYATKQFVEANGKGPAFSAYQSRTQAVSQNVYTKVLFDIEIFDTNNNFASSRFTPTVAGYYQLNTVIFNQLNTVTDAIYVRFYKNGSSYQYGASSVGNINNYASVTLQTVMYFNGSTDYVEVYGNSPANATNFYQGTFSACLVRGA